jgi:hypothetical protein
LAGCGGSRNGNGDARTYASETSAALAQPPEARATALIKLAYRRAKAKDELGADQTFQQAAAACREIKDPAVLLDAYALMAEAHARLGNLQAAQYATKSAADVLGRITDPEAKSRSLVTLAEVQALAKQTSTALDNLKTAEQAATEIKAADGSADRYAQAIALGRVAVGYLEAGQADQADRVIQTAIGQADSLDQERLRAVAVAEIATILHKAKKADLAAKTFQKAVAAARKIAKPQPKAHALAEVGQKLAAAGQYAQGKQLLEEADSVAHQIPEADLQQQAIAKIRKIMDEK